ncbi:hypothetical protein OTU49_016594 [Cherax quadricarinatus]|uniref:RING-type domain-containing protein n=1 Tax=Cherax quadricarinatus TaxID=27406 RepID=A0AAW0YCA3_CHEQU
MATYCPEDLASRELSCPICFEDYDIQDVKRTPKLLLCLHTFCYDCAKKLWRNDGSIECSLCRMLHEEVRVDDLLDNYVIIQHLRSLIKLFCDSAGESLRSGILSWLGGLISTCGT